MTDGLACGEVLFGYSFQPTHLLNTIPESTPPQVLSDVKKNKYIKIKLSRVFTNSLYIYIYIFIYIFFTCNIVLHMF